MEQTRGTDVPSRCTCILEMTRHGRNSPEIIHRSSLVAGALGRRQSRLLMPGTNLIFVNHCFRIIHMPAPHFLQKKRMCRIIIPECKILDPGSWIQDTRSRIQAPPETKDLLLPKLEFRNHKPLKFVKTHVQNHNSRI